MGKDIQRTDLIAQLVAKKAPVFHHFPFRIPNYFIAHHDPRLHWRSDSSTMPAGSINFRRDNEELSKSWERAAVWADIPDEEFEALMPAYYDGVWSKGFNDALRKIGADTNQDVSFESEFVQRSQYWRCPSCWRRKHDTIRLSKKGSIVARIVGHHDHVSNHLGYGSAVRFLTTPVCEDCNNADMTAKSRLNAMGLRVPNWFSFTPEEIGKFSNSKPHRAHEVDLSVAQYLFECEIVSEFISRVEERTWPMSGFLVLDDEGDEVISFYKPLEDPHALEPYGDDIALALDLDFRAVRTVLADRSAGSLLYADERCRIKTQM